MSQPQPPSGAMPAAQPFIPAYTQPQFVMMPVAQRNALGTFGFVVALIGVFVPTGIVALLGLVLSLAAIGRSPRGMATMGVILGLLGTVFWFVVMAVMLLVGAVAAVTMAAGAAVGFAVTNPEVIEVSSDMVNVAVAVEEYNDKHGTRPDGLAMLALGVAAETDPWGGAYRLTAANADSDLDIEFDVLSGGPDATFGTDDDIRLSRLDEFWSASLESFEERMNELDRRMQVFRHSRHSGCAKEAIAHSHSSTYETYESKARNLVEQSEPHDGEPDAKD